MKRTPMKRKLIALLAILLLSLPAAFADPISGSSDAVLQFYPRSVTYDRKHAIELQAKAVPQASEIGDSPLSFDANSAHNLSIFRLYDTLHNEYKSIPPRNGETYSNYNGYIGGRYFRADEVFQKENMPTVTIQTTGVFRSVDDPSVTRPFSLACILTDAVVNNYGTGYIVRQGPKLMASGTSYTLNDGTSTSVFTNLGNGTYTLTIPSTPIVMAPSNYYFPLYTRVFDLCVVLPENAGLPDGYYTTEISITSTSFNNRTFTGDKTTEGGATTVGSNTSTVSITENITVWGYVGDAGQSENPGYSFSVSQARDTFSMDLASDDYYSVASVNFSASINNSAYKTNDSNTLGKYVVYISSTSSYATSTEPYLFQRTNGGDTIEYELFTDSVGTAFGSGVQSADFSGSGKVAGTTSYYMLPKYSFTKHDHSGSQPTYDETWSFAGVNVYLKVKDASQTHMQGQYKSKLYFTLVSN